MYTPPKVLPTLFYILIHIKKRYQSEWELLENVSFASSIPLCCSGLFKTEIGIANLFAVKFRLWKKFVHSFVGWSGLLCFEFLFLSILVSLS